MKVYMYSEARQKLAEVLRESRSEEVVIRRRGGDTFSVAPIPRRRRSPFSVPCLNKGLTRREILEALDESRHPTRRRSNRAS
jgi:prevent-host-death family protein